MNQKQAREILEKYIYQIFDVKYDKNTVGDISEETMWISDELYKKGFRSLGYLKQRKVWLETEFFQWVEEAMEIADVARQKSVEKREIKSYRWLLVICGEDIENTQILTIYYNVVNLDRGSEEKFGIEYFSERMLEGISKKHQSNWGSIAFWEKIKYKRV